jgi:RND family efflux transporter MFP subunit
MNRVIKGILMNVTHDESTESAHPLNGAAEPAHSQMKFKTIALVIGAICILVAFGLIPRLVQRAALKAETREAAVPKVSVIRPIPGNASAELLLPAEIQPWVEAPIHARANGFLKQWLVDIGMNVKAGQLLAVIETPELGQELEQAQHQLAQSEAALAMAKITAARYAELIKSSSVSEQDNAEKQSDQTLKTAVVSASQANVRRLEYMQAFTRVKAPFSGTITARSCDMGDLITASGKELFHLSQMNKLRIYVRVPQTHALNITPGQTAELLIPELPGNHFTAKVIRTAGEISDDSRTLLTQLEVDNSDGKILAGSFGQVKFMTPKSSSTLTLPSNAVTIGAEGPHVALVNQDGTIEVRKVRLGINFGQTIELLAGVGSEDRVVSNPSEALTSGLRVVVVEPGKNAKGEKK